MNARQRRYRNRNGFQVHGFIRELAKTPPEITRLGQFYSNYEYEEFIAIGDSWDTAQWVKIKNDQDAINKMAQALKIKRSKFKRNNAG